MKKTIVFIAMILITNSIFAQKSGQKFGYVDSKEVLSLLPEAQKTIKDFIEFQQAYKLELESYILDYTKKDSIFIKDSLSYDPTTKIIKQKDLYILANKAKNFESEAKTKIKQREDSLILYLNKKAVDLITEVATENNYTYVIEKSYIIFGSPGEDLMPYIKKKLAKKIK